MAVSTKTSLLRRASLEQTECRICCEVGENKTDGPLLTPCHCSGSMKHIHLECLTKSIESRNSAHCEVCLTKFTQIEIRTHRPSFGKFLRENPDICTELIFAILVSIFLQASLFCQIFIGPREGSFWVQFVLQVVFLIFYIYYMLYFYSEWLEENMRVQVVNKRTS